MKHILQVREHIGGETMAEASRFARSFGGRQCGKSLYLAATLGISLEEVALRNARARGAGAPPAIEVTKP